MSWLVTMLGTALPVAAQRVTLETAAAADTSLRHAVRLRDGTLLIGRVQAVTADSVRIALLSGGMTSVARGAVVEVQQVSAARLRQGSYWFENPHTTRLLFSATAFPLKEGAGYYSNTWLFLHSAAVGLTDRFALGGGFSLIPGLGFLDNVFYLLPKYTLVERPRGRLAVGALLGSLPFDACDDCSGEDDRTAAGLLYVVGTGGDHDSNLSLGLGWGYVDDDVASRPVVMAGFQVRAARRVALISENWFFPDNGSYWGLWSFGLRFLGESIAVDLALVNSFEEPITPGVPWLGFAFRF
jgi:hypothetical protein